MILNASTLAFCSIISLSSGIVFGSGILIKFIFVFKVSINACLRLEFFKTTYLFLDKFSTVENLFSFSNQSEINIIKFSNIAIVFGTFKNIEFNKSTDIIIPVTLKNVSVMATPWHTGTPGNLTIMSYGEKNKITIRANNNGTNLTTVSGTFIAIGTM